MNATALTSPDDSLARLERLYQESLGELREMVGAWAAHFQRVLETQDERQIREVRQDLSQRVNELGQDSWR